eukprot:gene11423-11569_t
MSEDDDDLPDELWDMLDTIERQKHQEHMNAAGPAANISNNDIIGTAAAAHPGTASTGHQQQPQLQTGQPTQQQSPHDFKVQLQLAQQQVAQHAAAAAQLKHQLMMAQQEKQQLQQRLQSSNQQHGNGMDRHWALELQKQLSTLQQRLMFAEQEAQEAQKKAAEKDNRTAQAEQQLRKLHQDLSSREELMLQLQHELNEERQRAERQAVAAAAAVISSTPSGYALAGAPAAASGGRQTAAGTSPAGSARKRRLGEAPLSGAAGVSLSQISRPLTAQMLWISCPAAIQQLLQPLPLQVLGLLQPHLQPQLQPAHATGQDAAAPAAAGGLQPTLQQLPAALAAVQLHLQATAGNCQVGAAAAAPVQPQA